MVPEGHVICPGCAHDFPAVSERARARDHCAVAALRLALKHLGHPISVVENGNVHLTPKGQDIEYIRMTLGLYDDLRKATEST